MLGVLVSVVILVLLFGVVALHGTSPPQTPHNGPLGSTTTTAPSTIGAGANEASHAACVADYQMVQSALGTYRALNGHSPQRGTAWATSKIDGLSQLTAWPSGAPYFEISWNGSTLDVLVTKGLASVGSAGSATSRSGCYGF